MRILREMLAKRKPRNKRDPRMDSYAVVRWSIDDAKTLEDAAGMTDAELCSFMEYAEKQLREDMVERGWYSLEDLLDLYLTETRSNKSPEADKAAGCVALA